MSIMFKVGSGDLPPRATMLWSGSWSLIPLTKRGVKGSDFSNQGRQLSGRGQPVLSKPPPCSGGMQIKKRSSLHWIAKSSASHLHNFHGMTMGRLIVVGRTLPWHDSIECSRAWCSACAIRTTSLAKTFPDRESLSRSSRARSSPDNPKRPLASYSSLQYDPFKAQKPSLMWDKVN